MWAENSALTARSAKALHSVGVVRDAVIAWGGKHYTFDTDDWWSLPVVAETWDGWLNDINGFHVKPEHAFAALDIARSGPVTEGNVGGGTGMICYEFKCGIGTASRVVEDEGKRYTLGVLLQANFGRRSELLVAGVPVGKEVPEQPAYAALASKREDRDLGSVIVIVATDAPLLPHQLDRIARRVTMGIARSGAVAGNGSGDIFLAFSTANHEASAATGLPALQMLPNVRITPIFTATVQAVDEAVMNALVAARTTTGFEGNTAIALPHAKLRAALAKYNRLEGP